jgi:hypothetical protein
MFDPEGTENEFGQKHPYERGRLGYPDEEFTLAMDLPFKVNVKEVFSKAGRAECVREMEKERVWTPPGLAVDCR